MSFLLFIIILAIEGLVIGAFARFALPGRDPMSLLQTMAVGLAGAFIAGIVFYLLFDEGPGFLGALVFATLIVYVIRRRRGGGLMEPGEAPRR